MNIQNFNSDPTEISKFDQVSDQWWKRQGEFKALHDINPLRLSYVNRFAPLNGKTVVDVGCGGGILTEAMAQKGADVIGIDMSLPAIQVAKNHLRKSGLSVDYQLNTAENLARINPAGFDIVTCMELLEHVPDPKSVVRACARLVRPGGDIFFGTINRTFAAYLLVILVAEYVLHILQRGTHTYQKFIAPQELTRIGVDCGLKPCHVSGFIYLPMIGKGYLWKSKSMNYLIHFKRAESK